jgi:tetratricopeptide (TPR) repeat protein
MFFEKWKDAFIDNIQAITAIVGAVVVALVVAAGVSEYFKHREKKAVEALYQARMAFDAIPADRRAVDGVAVLEKIVKDEKGTRAAYEALVTIGDTLIDAKKFDEAAKYFANAADAAPDEFARVLALYSKASAEESGANCKVAVVTYTELGKIKGAKFLTPEALLSQGRCFENLGEFAKASEAYQRIQNEFPNNSFYTNAAQVFLEKLKPRLAN